MVVFETYFNPNNSLLIILQISLLFGFTPALRPFAVHVQYLGGNIACAEETKNVFNTPKDLLYFWLLFKVPGRNN